MSFFSDRVIQGQSPVGKFSNREWEIVGPAHPHNDRTIPTPSHQRGLNFGGGEKQTANSQADDETDRKEQSQSIT